MFNLQDTTKVSYLTEFEAGEYYLFRFGNEWSFARFDHTGFGGDYWTYATESGESVQVYVPISALVVCDEYLHVPTWHGMAVAS